MKRGIVRLLLVALVMVCSAGVAAALSQQFAPKIEAAEVTRSRVDLHSGEWTYKLNVQGTNFSTESRVEIDGQPFKGYHRYITSTDEVYQIEVVLGQWSPIYVPPAKHSIVVMTPVRTRDGTQELRSDPVELEY
jgi:hypothetical protein